MDNETIVKQEVTAGLTQRAALIMAANIVALSLMFILPLVLVRTLTQFEFGLYKQAFQILVTALALLNLQVAVSVFYFMARVPDKKLQVVMNVVVFYGLVGLGVFLLFLVWPTWVNYIFKTGDLVPYIPLLGLVIFIWLISNNLESVPIAAGDVRVASVLIVLSQLTKSIVMVGAAIIFGTITSILLASLIQALLQMVFVAIYLRKRFGSFWKPFDFPLFKAQIGSSLPFGIGGIAAIIQSDMHNYFVSHHFDAAQFAIYSVGCFQLPLLGMLANSFASALNPELAKHKETNDFGAIIEIWVDVIRKLAFFFFPAYAVMLVLRVDLITALFTKDYIESVPLFAVTLTTIILGTTIHLHVLRLFDQLRYFRLRLYLALIPVTAIALYAGFRMKGLLGISIAVVFINSLDIGITLIRVGKELRVKLSDLTRLKLVLRTALSALAAALVTMLLMTLVPQYLPIIRFLIGASIFGLIYLIAVLVFGAITRDELTQIRGMIRTGYEKGTGRLKSSFSVLTVNGRHKGALR